MATFSISATARKAQASGNGSAGPFSFAFQVNAQAEVDVYVNTTLKTLSTHYTVSLSGDGTGSVSFTSGNHPTSAQTITILGDAPLSRASVYTSGGNITAAALESDFDTNVMVQQQQEEILQRTVKAPVDEASSSDMTLPSKDDRKGTVLGFNATSGNPEAGPTISAVQSVSDASVAINLLGTAAVVEDMGLLSASAVIEDMAILGTSGNVANMAKLGTDAVITDMAILGTSAIVADMAILGTDDVVADMAILATSDVVADMNVLATAAIVQDMAILGTADVVADMNALATSDIISDLNTLANSDIVADLNTLATPAIVEDMSLLATSAVIEDMGLLATSAVIEDMGLLATSAVIEDMGLLATSAVIADMASLANASSPSITNLTTSGLLALADGSPSAPSLTNTGDTDTGLYFPASNQVGIVVGSSPVVNISNTGVKITPVFGSGTNALVLNNNDTSINNNNALARIIATADDPTVDKQGAEILFLSAGSWSTDSYPTEILFRTDNSGSLTNRMVVGSTGIDVTGTVTATGTSVFASLDISGDIDVDGTTNLDIVDIDGAVDMASTLAVTGIATFTDDIIIGDGKTIGSASDVDAITIAANGQVTLTQTLIGTGLDISGAIDVDGITHLDIVDIDGAVNMATTALVTGVLTTTAATVHTNGITMPDSAKAIFGAGSNLLQIYHDSSGSYVKEGGTGSLYLQGTDVRIQNASGEDILKGSSNGAVTLFYDSAAKLATTNTGIDVTGQATLTSGQLNFAGSISDPNGAAYIWRPADNTLAFGTANEERLRIDASGSVGIGTSSPNQLLEVANSSGGATISISTDQAAGSIASKKYMNLDFTGYNNTVMARVQSWDESSSTGNGYLTFHTIPAGGSLTERMRITSSGNINISSDDKQIYWGAGTTAIDASSANNRIRFFTNNSEKMQIDSNGTVGIGQVPATDWRSDYDALQVGAQGVMFAHTAGGGDASTWITNNAYVSTGGWKALSTNEASHYQQKNGEHYWSNAPSVSAGAGLAFTNRMRINSAGTAVVTSTGWDLVFDAGDTNITGVQQGPQGFVGIQNDTNGTTSEAIVVNNINSLSATQMVLQYRTRQTVEGSVQGNGSGLSFVNVSDYRKKDNITNLSGSLAKIKALRPVTFTHRSAYTTDTSAVKTGMIAHEVAEVLPNLVVGEKNAVDEDGNIVLQALAYSGDEMITHLIGAIKELETTITTLTDRITALEG